MNVLQIACGSKHTMILAKEIETKDSSLLVCGSNEHGQLGLPNIYEDQVHSNQKLHFSIGEGKSPTF